MIADPFLYSPDIKGQDSGISGIRTSRSITSLKLLFEKQENNRKIGLQSPNRHSMNSEGASDLLYQDTIPN